LALAIVGTTWARPLAAEDVAAQAHQLLLDGKADDALQNLQQAVARQADHAGAWFELARTQFYLMKLDDAQKSIARAIQLDPRRARYHYLAGQLAAYNAVLKYKSEETRDQAPKLMGQWVRELEQTAKLDPQFDEAQVELVNAYLQAPGDQGGSREKAEQVVAGLETRSPVAAAKGRCMLIEDKQKKVELWQAMVERHPEDAAARAELARAYMRNEQTAKAKEQVDEALRIDAKQGALLLDYFRHVALQQQFGPAAEALDQYLQLVPPPPVPLRATATFYRATLAKRQQKNEEAEKLLAAAKEMDPHVWMTFRQPPELLFD
jgi:tetratricopeptide (TPR) repeat protein